MKNLQVTFQPNLPIFLGVVFIILKLCNFIDWGWIWVLSPFWIPFVIVVAAALLMVVVGLIAGIIHGTISFFLNK